MEYTQQDVTDHMGLVYKLAHRLRPQYAGASSLMDFDDLVSEGVLGLIRAFEAFDPDKGAKFITYACYRIRGFIQDAHRRLHKEQRQAKKLGLAPPKIVSFDAPVSSPTFVLGAVESETTLYDLLVDETFSESDAISRLDAMKFWRGVWPHFSPTQREVMGLMLSGLRQVDVARKRGVTATAVSVQYHAALKKARQHYLHISREKEVA